MSKPHIWHSLHDHRCFPETLRVVSSQCPTENLVFKAGHTWTQTFKAPPTWINKFWQALNSATRFLVSLSEWLYHFPSGIGIFFFSSSLLPRPPYPHRSFLSFWCFFNPLLSLFLFLLNLPCDFCTSPISCALPPSSFILVTERLESNIGIEDSSR